jgi:hypothetical protein
MIVSTPPFKTRALTFWNMAGVVTENRVNDSLRSAKRYEHLVKTHGPPGDVCASRYLNSSACLSSMIWDRKFCGSAPRLQGSLARRHSRGKLRQTIRLVEPVLRHAAALRGHRQFPRDGIPYPDFRIHTGLAPFDRVPPGFRSTFSETVEQS